MVPKNFFTPIAQWQENFQKFLVSTFARLWGHNEGCHSIVNGVDRKSERNYGNLTPRKPMQFVPFQHSSGNTIFFAPHSRNSRVESEIFWYKKNADGRTCYKRTYKTPFYRLMEMLILYFLNVYFGNFSFVTVEFGYKRSIKTVVTQHLGKGTRKWNG